MFFCLSCFSSGWLCPKVDAKRVALPSDYVRVKILFVYLVCWQKKSIQFVYAIIFICMKKWLYTDKIVFFFTVVLTFFLRSKRTNVYTLILCEKSFTFHFVQTGNFPSFNNGNNVFSTNSVYVLKRRAHTKTLFRSFCVERRKN